MANFDSRRKPIDSTGVSHITSGSGLKRVRLYQSCPLWAIYSGMGLGKIKTGIKTENNLLAYVI